MQDQERVTSFTIHLIDFWVQMDNNVEPAYVYVFDSDANVCLLDEDSTTACKMDPAEIDDCLSIDSYEDIDKRNPFVCPPASRVCGENDEFDEPSQEEMDAATLMVRQRSGSEFDVLDHDEIQSAYIQDRSNNLYSTALPPGPSSCGGTVRQNLVKLHLAKRESEFTDLQPFTILVGTWNINGKLPSESLTPWLVQHTSDGDTDDNDDNLPDIVAVGFQELDLSVEALVRNNNHNVLEDRWIESVSKTLPSDKYVKLKHVRLVGIMLVVYALRKHKLHIRSVEASSYATGMLGLMGNKGGVAIRLQLHHSTICFVNSHLAAFQEQVARRNQDFNAIYRNLKFSAFQPPLNISNHDMAFWLGDLNYRIDLDIEKVKQLCDDNDYESLYAHDQLNKQRIEKNYFVDFIESRPTFKPTYKFDPGTDVWDSSEKGRIPAWCDRILWKGKNIEQETYTCHSELKVSDHKPVSSRFIANYKVVDPEREQQVVAEIIRQLDKEENDCLPQVNVSSQDLDFGAAAFLDKTIRHLSLENVGNGIVQYEFVKKSEEQSYCQPWFSLSPVAGFIMTGENAEIEIVLHVDKNSIPVLRSSNYKLNDILVLHLAKGKDYFISLTAEYKPSVFGSSLAMLVSNPGPITDIPLEALLESDKPTTPDDFHHVDHLEVPLPLSVLTNHIQNFGMAKENILIRDIGTTVDLVEIRKYLDSGSDKSEVPGSIYSIGNALLLFLESLTEPVIPSAHYSKCLQACTNMTSSKQLVDQLPPINFNVFSHVCAFLRELLQYSDTNKLDIKILASLFGPILLRSPPTEKKGNGNRKDQYQISGKKTKFLSHFLVNELEPVSH